MEIKLTGGADVRIVIACRQPKRPIELLKQFGTSISYSYLNQRLSVLAALGVLVRRNSRERGKNSSWYTSKPEYLQQAEEILRDECNESET